MNVCGCFGKCPIFGICRSPRRARYLAAGDLKNVLGTPKGAFAALNGTNVMADYLRQAGKLTSAAIIIEDFRVASAARDDIPPHAAQN